MPPAGHLYIQPVDARIDGWIPLNRISQTQISYLYNPDLMWWNITFFCVIR